MEMKPCDKNSVKTSKRLLTDIGENFNSHPIYLNFSVNYFCTINCTINSKGGSPSGRMGSPSYPTDTLPPKGPDTRNPSLKGTCLGKHNFTLRSVINAQIVNTKCLIAGILNKKSTSNGHRHHHHHHHHRSRCHPLHRQFLHFSSKTLTRFLSNNILNKHFSSNVTVSNNLSYEYK